MKNRSVLWTSGLEYVLSTPCLSEKAYNLGGLLYETPETEALCHSRYGTIKISPCSKVVCDEHGPKFLCHLTAMVKSPIKRNILKWDIKQQQTNKTKTNLDALSIALHGCFMERHPAGFGRSDLRISFSVLDERSHNVCIIC